MYARVTTFPGLAPERIKATVAEFEAEHLPEFERQPGYEGVWVGIDFTGGRALAITYWESLEAMRATDQIAHRARAAAVTRSGVDRERPPLIDNYEVALDKRPAHA
jgi:heme-degrading monooxygenase HmoA